MVQYTLSVSGKRKFRKKEKYYASTSLLAKINMPVIKSAIKKLRQDKKSEKENDAFRKALDKAIKTAKKDNSPKSISSAFSLADKAAKKHLIHANKAARIKSSLVKQTGSTATPTSIKPKAVKKTASKVKKTKATTSKTK